MAAPAGAARGEKMTVVRNRRVFYIPGYDPVPPRRYRELYRKEAAAQAAVSGHEIALRPGRGAARFGWEVTARIEGEPVETAVEVLAWSDIVKDSMDRGILATYLRTIRTAAGLYRHGRAFPADAAQGRPG